LGNDYDCQAKKPDTGDGQDVLSQPLPRTF